MKTYWSFNSASDILIPFRPSDFFTSHFLQCDVTSETKLSTHGGRGAVAIGFNAPRPSSSVNSLRRVSVHLGTDKKIRVGTGHTIFMDGRKMSAFAQFRMALIMFEIRQVFLTWDEYTCCISSRTGSSPEKWMTNEWWRAGQWRSMEGFNVSAGEKWTDRHGWCIRILT